MKVIWSTFASAYNESSIMKQHAFKALSSNENPFGEYEGNKSLCGKSFAMDGGTEKLLKLDEIDSEERTEFACKLCGKQLDKKE